jgi:hypothetical protein
VMTLDEGLNVISPDMGLTPYPDLFIITYSTMLFKLIQHSFLPVQIPPVFLLTLQLSDRM